MSRTQSEHFDDEPAAHRLPLKARVVQLMDEERLRCLYQPLVEVESERIVGYEALARFYMDDGEIAPNLVFGALHDDPTLLFALEQKLKTIQVRWRPAEGTLFVNLDPAACVEPYQARHWMETFRGHPDVVIELVENTTAQNVAAVQAFMRDMRGLGVRCALDDVGAPASMFCFDLLDDCAFIKLDRRWFRRVEADSAYGNLLRGLVDFTRARKMGCIIEGVQSRHHLELARDFGIVLAQGSLFDSEVIRAPSGEPPRTTVKRTRAPSRSTSVPRTAGRNIVS